MKAHLDACRNIYAVGRNYAAHAAELGNEAPESPVIFTKNLSSLSSLDVIDFPESLGSVHFELELVLRVGEDVARCSFSSLKCLDAIGLGIDFTARERQTELKEKGLPWALAKNFRHACWMAGLLPWQSWAAAFSFRLYQNDVLVQDGHVKQMIFSITEILACLNTQLDLHEGDLIFTGTPSGVGPVADGDELRAVLDEPFIDRRVRIQRR